MKRELDLVKTSPSALATSRAPDAFRRHLRGYELGLLTLGIVLTFAALVLPRASVPETLPLPEVDRRQAERRATRDRELAERARAQGLPFAVRAVGESIRHFGYAVAHGLDPRHDREDIHERLALLKRAGQTPKLLELRAVQTDYFLAELTRFERDGQQSRELEELSGNFIAQARRNHWFTADGRLLADEATRRVLFQMHWADLVEQRDAFPFAPSLDEWRSYYRFLLRYPEPAGPGELELGEDAARLRIVDALARKDPEYPALFAKGTLFHRLGQEEAAASAFRAHLGRHESGPYALLARNYLIHTLRNVRLE